MVAVKYAFTYFNNNGRYMWKLSSIGWKYITMIIAQTIKDSSNFVLIQCWVEPDGKDIIDHTVDYEFLNVLCLSLRIFEVMTLQLYSEK